MNARCVRDLMVHDVSVIRSDSDIHELERVLLRERIHGLPVVDAEGRLVGVVSQTDLLAWHHNAGVEGTGFYESPRINPSDQEPGMRVGDVRSARIEEVMSPVIHCILPDQKLNLAAARMLTRRVHRLVVVDEEGRVQGLISALDLLRALPGVAKEMDTARDEKRLADGITNQRRS